MHKASKLLLLPIVAACHAAVGAVSAQPSVTVQDDSGYKAQDGVLVLTVGGTAFAIPLKADGTLNGDTVFPTLVQTLLPTGFRGLVVAGMIAALMSSLASLFNSVSTLFTVDVYQKLKPAASERQMVFVGRTTTVVIGIVAACYVYFWNWLG